MGPVHRLLTTAALASAFAVALHAQQQQQQPPPGGDDSRFRFKSGVELVNVTATVTDATGRFVPNLRQEDFLIYEDDQPQQVTHFSAERVPVSLGVALDTSGSMAGDKIREAEAALERFMYDLLDQNDELFLYRFSNYANLLQGWTKDRQQLARALGRLTANGGTAMYDAVAEAVPLAAQGQNRKKALVVISDGNDTASQTTIIEVKQMIRESEVMVYAIGIDGDGGSSSTSRQAPPTARNPPPPRIPLPFPIPGRSRPGGSGGGWPPPGGSGGGTSGGWPRAGGSGGRNDDRVNVAALRDMTDDSGGRTEIVHDAHDLNPATANIADELSRQYYLGYPATARKDGRWHSIRVEVRNRNYRVRARRGYIAS